MCWCIVSNAAARNKKKRTDTVTVGAVASAAAAAGFSAPSSVGSEDADVSGAHAYAGSLVLDARLTSSAAKDSHLRSPEPSSATGLERGSGESNVDVDAVAKCLSTHSEGNTVESDSHAAASCEFWPRAHVGVAAAALAAASVRVPHSVLTVASTDNAALDIASPQQEQCEVVQAASSGATAHFSPPMFAPALDLLAPPQSYPRISAPSQVYSNVQGSSSICSRPPETIAASPTSATPPEWHADMRGVQQVQSSVTGPHVALRHTVHSVLGQLNPQGVSSLTHMQSTAVHSTQVAESVGADRARKMTQYVETGRSQQIGQSKKAGPSIQGLGTSPHITLQTAVGAVIGRAQAQRRVSSPALVKPLGSGGPSSGAVASSATLADPRIAVHQAVGTVIGIDHIQAQRRVSSPALVQSSVHAGPRVALRHTVDSVLGQIQEHQRRTSATLPNTNAWG